MTAQDWIDTINRIIRNLCVLAMVALVATCARAEQPYTVAQCLAEGEIIANAALGRDYGAPPQAVCAAISLRANETGSWDD